MSFKVALTLIKCYILIIYKSPFLCFSLWQDKLSWRPYQNPHMLSYAYSIFLIYDCNKPTTLVPWNAIYLSLEKSTHLMQLKALNISPILGFIMFNSTLSIIFFYIKNYWSKISYVFLTGHLAALHSVVESSKCFNS